MNLARQPLPPGPMPASFGKRRSKYGVAHADDRTFDGRKYASKAQMLRAVDWYTNVRIFRDKYIVAEEPSFLLGCSINVYKPDWLIVDLGSAPRKVWAEEVKGLATAKFRRDVKLWRQYGPCPLHILTRDGATWKTEIIQPQESGRHG